VRGQPRHQRRVHRAQEAGGKLVQQAADFFGGVVEELGLAVTAMTGGTRTFQRVFQRPRQCRQVCIAHGGRAAGQ
jgi:hypothetical protein